MQAGGRRFDPAASTGTEPPPLRGFRRSGPRPFGAIRRSRCRRAWSEQTRLIWLDGEISVDARRLIVSRPGAASIAVAPMTSEPLRRVRRRTRAAWQGRGGFKPARSVYGDVHLSLGEECHASACAVGVGRPVDVGVDRCGFGCGAAPPAQDPFYTYGGSDAAGADRARHGAEEAHASLHIVGSRYRSRRCSCCTARPASSGRPTVNVTSVLKPPLQLGTPQVVSYQSFYDSLNPDDEPSYAISGGG